MSTESFWGDIEDLEPINTPASILRKQAEFLGNKTGNQLRCEVKGRPHGDNFIYDFDIIVPALEYYEYTLLTIDHGINLYPLHIDNHLDPIRGVILCNSEEEFNERLRIILSSDEVKNLLHTLISQISS